jgi:hypothetical protein
MSVRSRIVTAALALSLAGGLSAAITPVAHAATDECGFECVDFFNSLSGPPASPALVLAAQGGGAAGRIGQPITLARASNTNPAEDFTVNGPDLVSDFIQAGLIAPGMGPRYGCRAGVTAKTCPPGTADLYAFEIEYSPYDAPTGYCVGVGSTPFWGTPVTLQPCGVNSETLWIYDPVTTTGACYGTMISGATNMSFSDPYVLTNGSSPGSLFTFNVLNAGHGVIGNQRWGVDFGVLPKPEQSCSGAVRIP